VLLDTLTHHPESVSWAEKSDERPQGFAVSGR